MKVPMSACLNVEIAQAYLMVRTVKDIAHHVANSCLVFLPTLPKATAGIGKEEKQLRDTVP